MEQKAIYELLAEHLGEGALGFNEEGPDAYADIAPAKIADAALFLRDDERLQFNQLMCLSGHRLGWLRRNRQRQVRGNPRLFAHR